MMDVSLRGGSSAKLQRAFALAVACLAATESLVRADTTTSQIAYFKFDEASGTLVDSTGNGNSIVAASQVGFTFGTTGYRANAGSFNGTTSYVAVPDNASGVKLDDVTGSWTMSAWVYRDANVVGLQTVAGRQATTTTTQSFWMGFNNDKFSVVTSSGSTCSSVNSITNLRWVHFAAVYNTTADTIVIYVNGTPNTYCSSMTGDPAAGDRPLLIGASNRAAATYQEFWSGRVDEFRLYNRALTAADVVEVAEGRMAITGAPKFWISASPVSWGCTSCWSKTAGGATDGTNTDVEDRLIFAAGGTGTCDIDGTKVVEGIDIQSTHTTGNVKITNTAYLTLRNNFNQSAGTFVGTLAGTLDVGGNFSVTGGTHTAVAGTTIVNGTFALTGGTFTANGGTVKLVGVANQTLTASGYSFNNLIIGGSSSGLLHHWKYDNSAVDFIGGAWNGTLNGNAAYTASAATVSFPNSHALTLDGTGDYVSHGTSFYTPLGKTASLTAWIKTSDTGNATFNLAPAITGIEVPGDNDIFWGWLDNTGKISLQSGNTTAAKSAVAVNDGAWHHVAMIREMVAGRKTIYVDGVLSGIAADLLDVSGKSAAFTSIGQAEGTGEFWNGQLDDIRVYDRPLSAVEVYQLAAGINAGSPAYTLGSNIDVNGALTLASGTVLGSSYTITVAGDWINSGGTFTSNTSTVNFDGIASGKTITSNANGFYNLTVSGTNGVWTLQDALAITNTYNQTSGTLDVGSVGNFGVTVAGSFTQTAGTFTPRAGTVTLTATTTGKTLSAASSLNNLVLNGSGGGWTLGRALDVDNDLTITAGTLDVDSTNNYGIAVGGNFSNAGTFTARAGTVTLDATTTGKTITPVPFHNLAVTGAGGGWTLADRLIATGTFSQSNGTFSVGASSYAMTVGNFSQTAGTFTPESGTVTVTSASASTLSAASSLYRLRIENPRETGLIAYWKFDDRSGLSSTDSSGNGNTGTLTGSPVISTVQVPTTSFHNPSSIQFSGTNYVTVPSSTSLNSPTTAMTISAWAHDTSGTMSTNNRRVIEKGGDSQFAMLSEGGNAMCRMVIGGVAKTSTKALPTSNAWHHWLCVYNNSTLTLYVDGVAGTSTAATGSIATTATSLDVGRKPGSGFAGDFFIGYIDDVRLYSTALTTTQIAALFAGRYPGGSTTNGFTLGSAVTATNGLAIESGKLSTAGYALNSSHASNALAVNAGTLSVGTGAVTASGGLTVRPAGTLEMPSTTTLSIGSGTTFTLDGTFTKAAGTTPTIQSVSGTYAFTVNSDTANPTAVLNIDGLNVKNTDTNGMNIAKATSATFTKFQNINFSNGTGTRLLYINGDSIALSAPGLTFDLGAGARTTTSNVVVAGTGSRYMFENRGTATNGFAVGEAYDGDNDNNTTPDGLADSGGSVVQWIWSAKTDTAGSIVGFPTAAFDWSDFSYYATYVAMKDIDGSTDRIYVRNANGDASYSWNLPGSVGDIIGTPRWDTIDGVHYVFVSTTTGYVYKLVDGGSSLVPAPSPWDTPYNQGANATVTSGLLTDANYIYWTGNNTSSSPTLFRLSNAAKGTATTQVLTAAVDAALALDNPSASAYVMAGTLGHLYRYDATNNTAPTDSTVISPAAIDGRIAVLNNALYAVDNAGKLIVVPTTSLNAATWTFQDATTHGSCSSGNNCQAKNLYLNAEDYLLTSGKVRVVFGDKDGHVYVVRQNGSTTSGVVPTGYPWKPNSDANPIVTAPLYQSGILVVGNSNGKVYVTNAFTAAGPATPALIQTYDFGTGVSIASVSRNRTTNSYAGAYLVATSNGKLFYLPASVDGDAYR